MIEKYGDRFFYKEQYERFKMRITMYVILAHSVSNRGSLMPSQVCDSVLGTAHFQRNSGAGPAVQRILVVLLPYIDDPRAYSASTYLCLCLFRALLPVVFCLLRLAFSYRELNICSIGERLQHRALVACASCAVTAAGGHDADVGRVTVLPAVPPIHHLLLALLVYAARLVACVCVLCG